MPLLLDQLPGWGESYPHSPGNRRPGAKSAPSAATITGLQMTTIGIQSAPRAAVEVRLVPNSRRKSPVAWLVVGGVLLLLVVCGGFFLVFAPFDKSRRKFIVENPQDQRKDLGEAFFDQKIFPEQDPKAGKKPLAADPQLVAQWQTLFRDLGNAFRLRDQNSYLTFWNGERLFDQIASQEGFNEPKGGQRQQYIRGLLAGNGQDLVNQQGLVGWTASEIRHAKQLGPDDWVVIVRHTQNDGIFLRMRWWLTRTTGAWLIYDSEELFLGIRYSVDVASLNTGTQARIQELGRLNQHLNEAHTAVNVTQDADVADRNLNLIAGQKLPKHLEGLRYLVTAQAQLLRRQPGPALDALVKAESFQPDMPCLNWFRGIAYNDLADWDKALKHLEAYRDLLGDDAGVCREIGESLRGLRRLPEARASYRKALDYDGKNANAFVGLMRALGPGDNRDDLGPRFAKLPNLRVNFDILAQDCRQARDAVGLEPIALTMKKATRTTFRLISTWLWPGRGSGAATKLWSPSTSP